MPTAAEIDLGTRIIALITAAGGIGGGGGAAPLATNLLTGTVKTDVLEVDPRCYTKATVDSNFYTKTAADALFALIAHSHTFASLTAKPTTVGGYGITDFNSLGDARWALLAHVHAGTDITTGLIAAARLGAGSGGAVKFLREDQSWQVPAGASDPAQGSFAPGSFTLPTGKYAIIADTLALAGVETAAVEGNALLRLI